MVVCIIRHLRYSRGGKEVNLLTPNEQRKLRKIIFSLRTFRDEYARHDDTVMASKFARAMVILMEALQEEKTNDA
jgi:hypothetical protein